MNLLCFDSRATRLEQWRVPHFRQPLCVLGSIENQLGENEEPFLAGKLLRHLVAKQESPMSWRIITASILLI